MKKIIFRFRFYTAYYMATKKNQLFDTKYSCRHYFTASCVFTAAVCYSERTMLANCQLSARNQAFSKAMK